jgi:hypothetical protein
LDEKEINRLKSKDEKYSTFYEELEELRKEIKAKKEYKCNLKELKILDITYHLMNVKKYNNTFDISLSNIFITFTEALLLLNNNMRIIVSKESKLKTRNKEPIFLLSK